ncbi:hypothetical protein DSO57_1013354 [Entomophthora muscae]|uniref:Uncharacterized protein n=1 Tax=Entomophthora muscae TaxID=34485 RepID=A0ACC2US38_9FUNG|nr:hypothetical protein DSO57_1013354 [Entomophthora muscae]
MSQEYPFKGREPSNLQASSQEKSPYQSSASGSFEDDESDTSPIGHQFKFLRSETEELTFDDCIAGLDTGLARARDSNLAEALTDLSDLGNFLSELENLDFKSFKPTRSSRLSIALVDDPQDDQPLSRLAPTPKKETPTPLEEAKIEAAKKKLQTANLKKITTKIYLESAKNHQTVQLTSFSTPELVIEGLIEIKKLADNKEWVMTEIHETFSVSRALKPWESILDVIEPWESDSPNALLIKPRQGEILTPEVSRDSPFMEGWLQVEVRKGKWEKRYAVLKRATLYIAKSDSISGASAICTLQNFEAFTLMQPRPKAPKRPLFALKSQQSIMLFERPEEDYIHFFACSSVASRDDWVRALRHSRSWAQYSAFVTRPTPFSPFVDDSLVKSNITGLQVDTGRFEELENPKAHGSSLLTKNNAGGIAGRLFRLVLTGDQGKTDIDRVVGAKALPDVFAEGSLLSKPIKTEEQDLTSSSIEEEVFKGGSLLSRGAATHSAAKDMSPTATEFQPNSLLNSLKPRNAKPQPLALPTKSGPLLQLQSKDAGMFQNGTLLHGSQPQHPISPRPQIHSQLSPSNHRNTSPTSPRHDAIPRSPNRHRPQRSPTTPLMGAGNQYSKIHRSGSFKGKDHSDDDDVPLKVSIKSPRKPPNSSPGLSKIQLGSSKPKEMFSQGSLLSRPSKQTAAPSGPLLQLSGKPEQNHTSQIKKQNLKPLISFK